MKKCACVFPGQGSQKPGMGKEFYTNSVEARRVFEEADAALGEPLSQLCFEGPAEQLKLTENAQPAILTVSLAAYRALGITPHVLAGHSLGEYSALVAAGVLQFADAIKLVRLRGRFMQEAVPVGSGAMFALVGNDMQEVATAIGQYGNGRVSVANYNSLKQVVISGSLPEVQDVARSLRTLKSLKLPVSAPFHCTLMLPAAEKLAEVMQTVCFSQPLIPVIRNIDASVITTGEEARTGLIEQVSKSVQWTGSIQYMHNKEGIDCFIEVGPGTVLSGLISQILPDSLRYTVQIPEDIVRVREAHFSNLT